MGEEAAQAFNLLLWFGGGGSIVATVLWGYAIYKAQKLWRADDKTIKEEVAKLISEQDKKNERFLLDTEKMLNSATGRLDKEIDSLKKEGRILHTRINDNQREMTNKVDREVELLGAKIDSYNVNIMDSLSKVLNKLGLLEGKISK